MGLPKWTTPAGNLGTIEENIFFRLELEASDTEGESVTYSLHSGALPSGLSLRSTGAIEGNPTSSNIVQGIPTEVGQDVTSVFVVRLSNESGVVNDRTFNITVTGQDKPQITNDSHLGTFVDGQRVSIQMEATDPDNDELTWAVSDGSLPPGLSISTDGLISGYLEPEVIGIDAPEGYSATPYDRYRFDFTNIRTNRNYQFGISVNDGKDIVQNVFTIFVYSADTFTADTTLITADTTGVLASYTSTRPPVLTTESSEIGRVTHDNYYAFRFVGRDFDGDTIKYEVTPGEDSEDSAITLPPGLVFDEDTGWLYGTLPDVVATQNEYEFGVRVYKASNPVYQSAITYFTFTLVGDIDEIVTWDYPQDLGEIRTGDISRFAVTATTSSGNDLTYTLLSGSNSKLPQGLKLLSNGLIVGRARFSVFSLDKGTTTFDVENTTFNTTTFDRKFTFTVNAKDEAGQIDATRTFTITVTNEVNIPYENLYLRAIPSLEDKALFKTLIQDSDIFETSKIYRPSDPNFGIQSSIQMLLESGLSPYEALEYVQGMAKNHYKKTIRFGDLKTARALDSNGNTIYEVLYIELESANTNAKGSTSKKIDLRRRSSRPIRADDTDKKASSSLLTADMKTNYFVYPNSFRNMRSAITSEVDKLTVRTLPLWMTSKQENDRVLGLINAAVIAYVKPGFSKEIAFKIAESEFNFKKISFQVDRYVWDKDLTLEFNKATQEYTDVNETTFDSDTTSFDGGSTIFIEGSIGYVEGDFGDQYLSFPQVNIFE